MSAVGLPALPRRMRIRKGRIMHRVRRAASGDVESLCRRPHPARGVSSTIPRAQGPEDWWSAERHWYPDCLECNKIDP